MSRKFIKALAILAPLIRIIEDIYRRDLVVYFRMYVYIIIKALIKFNTRYIAKGHLFCSIWLLTITDALCTGLQLLREELEEAS